MLPAPATQPPVCTHVKEAGLSFGGNGTSQMLRVTLLITHHTVGHMFYNRRCSTWTM